jgi:predicted dehydrogenase
MGVLRLGLVGAGEVAARHAAAALSVPGVRLAAVSDVDTGRARRLADSSGAVACADLVGLLAEVDLVVLTVPHAFHAELALGALAAGRHVLVEKPMATTVADCDRMIAAAARSPGRLYVGHQQRHFTAVRAARAVLAEGRLGRPLLYLERRSSDYTPGTRPAWFFDPTLAGGGIAMLVGVHTIDRASWLLDAVPVAVSGTVATPEGWQVETAAAGTLQFAAGPPAHFCLLHTGSEFFHETTIVCERGRVVLDPTGVTVVDQAGAAVRIVEADADQEYTLSFARQYEAVARSIQDGGPPPVPLAEARRAVAVVRALYESSATGRLVDVAER